MHSQQELEILYQEPSFVVVSKPGGMLAVPGRGVDKQDCVVTRLQKSLPECIAQPAVHRLDMATSGLMVLGLTRLAHRHLSLQFEKRTVVKRYVAVVDGLVDADTGRIELAFRLDPDNRPHQIYDPEYGKLGITRWRVLQRFKQQTKIEFFPETGRTHQLRLHSSHRKGLGHPIVGDSLYGDGCRGDQMLLHATGLQFLHPETGRVLCFFSSPPF